MESFVENKALERSGLRLRYDPDEKIDVIQVETFPQLGNLAALRYLEWVQNNPGGVISLPTGKTPEYFIKEVERYLGNWDTATVRKELESWGIDPGRKPDMGSLRFVQIDEFYPISPLQLNSFYYYVNKFYIRGFGLDARKALFINCHAIGSVRAPELAEDERLDAVWPGGVVDLSLRYRHPQNALESRQKSALEEIDQWCVEYENSIRAMGGIGFFLGGIGPDGHIGFNISGSDLHSTTRLTPTNYETQAAAAQDLGGIEVSRKRLVITIGLATIVYNPSCVAIIMAAGEAKARIVADAVRGRRHIRHPATILHTLSGARFFVTRGAASLLQERQLHILTRSGALSEERRAKILIDLSLDTKKPIEALKERDLEKSPFGKMLLRENSGDFNALKLRVMESLKSKIQGGSRVRSNVTFLHTEPHHDDIMLGYLPGVVRHIREHTTSHFFAALTSGFTAVTNSFMLERFLALRECIRSGTFTALLSSGYFTPGDETSKNRDVWQYLDGVAADSSSMKEEGCLRRLLRNLITLYGESDIDRLESRVGELIEYFKTQYAGKKDLPPVQRLKGMIREWEADCLWGYFGWHSDSILHLRLGFYTGDIFTEEPTQERDAMPILALLKRVDPDIVSVALDPEASGPDTHYKTLQAVTEALKIHRERSGRRDIRIWGYRNIWYRFHPSEANIFIPVSLNMFALQDNAFKNSYLSQKDASFPSYEYDGPFSELARKIQVEQYQMLKTCLGRAFFYEHQSALIRATRGFVFLKEMDLDEFELHSRALRRYAENL
jgi:glucosamine-6-phosphate deaminase